MANSNTFAALYNLAQTVPVTETVILAANHTTDTTRANSIVAPPVNAKFVDGFLFRVRVSGKVTDTQSQNITVKVYLNKGGNTNLTTFTNDIAIITTGTMATGGAGSLAFSHSSTCIWDSASARFAFYPDPGGLKSISGTSAVFVATAVIGNSGTAISSLDTADDLQFFATGLAGTGATASLVLTELALDQI